MGEALQKDVFTPRDYLAWEAEQATKHEYLAGEVLAMVGARREHVVVAGSFFARLREHLKGSRCSAYVSDMKLHVAAADSYFYPDVMVSCDERDRKADLALEHPVLLIEVLSEATAAYDRGEKFAAYRLLPSLQEFLLVDIDHRRLELFRRTGEHWTLFETRAGLPPITLASVNLTLDVAAAFEDLQD
jgi:Uma2 family endonuclease